MSQLHQLQLTYVPLQDRILFRMNTKARQEFRFWMTRRYVQILWKALLNLMKKKEAPKIKSVPMQEAAIAVKHEKAVQKSDFKTQYQPSEYLPIGDEPQLLFSVRFQNKPTGQTVLSLHPEKGQGVDLALNDQIVHSLCKLLVETSEKAGWGLKLDFTEAGKPAPEKGQGLN